MIQMHSLTRKPWAASLALVLVCALLWAQLLGLTHRVVHGPQLTGSVVFAQTSAATSGEVGLLATLFAGHQGADCSTFDQLNHAYALVDAPPQALPALAPLPPLAVVTVFLLLQHTLRLQARGPPMSL